MLPLVFFGVVTILLGIYVKYLKIKIEKKYNFIKIIGKIVETEFYIDEKVSEDKVGYKLSFEYVVNNQRFINNLKSFLNIEQDYIFNKKLKPGDSINLKYSLSNPDLIILDENNSYKFLILIGLFLIFLSISTRLILLCCLLCALCVSIFKFNYYLKILLKAKRIDYVETQGELVKYLKYRTNDRVSVYTKLIRFIHNGKVYYCFSSYASNIISNEQIYIVKFNPNNPDDSVLKYEKARLLMFFVSILGIIICLYAFNIFINNFGFQI